MERQGEKAGGDNACHRTKKKKSNNNDNNKNSSSKREQDSEAVTRDSRKDYEVCKIANFTERKKLIKSKRNIQQGLIV